MILGIIVGFFVVTLFIFLLNFFDSKDQNVDFFDLLAKFFKDYSIRYEEFTFLDIWNGLLDFNNNVVWITVFMFFSQLTLLIPQFLFNKFKEYAEKEEIAVTERVEVSVDSYGGVSAREANIYNTYRPYIWKTILAIFGSVAVFIPILYGIIKYISPIYMMLIVVIIDILIIIFACMKKRQK